MVSLVQHTLPSDFAEFLTEIEHLTFTVLPDGYDVGPDAPNTWADAREYYAKHGTVKVLPGADPNGILPEGTYSAFRAWHDYVHITCGARFTDNGENEAAIIQGAMLAARVGPAKAKRWLDLIQAEVVDSNKFERHEVEVA